MVRHSALIQRLLDNLVSVSDYIKKVFICDLSGKLVGISSNEWNEEPNYSRFLNDIATEASEMFKKQTESHRFGTGIFYLDDMEILFNQVGSTAILFTIVDPKIIPNYVMTYAFMVSDKIANLIENEFFEGFNVEVPNFRINRIMDEASIDSFERQEIKVETERGEYSVAFLNRSKRDMLYKFILLGDPAVGKTSLIQKYTSGRFRDDYIPTLGISITEHNYEIDGFVDSTIKILFWDLAGQENFKYARKIYVDGAHAGFIVYSVTDKDSFKNVKQWYKALSEDIGRIPLILVANKIDLDSERVISQKDGLKLAERLGCAYMETSAKTGENVKFAFRVLALGLFFAD